MLPLRRRFITSDSIIIIVRDKLYNTIEEILYEKNAVFLISHIKIYHYIIKITDNSACEAYNRRLRHYNLYARGGE